MEHFQLNLPKLDRPELSLPELSREAGAMWKRLSEDEKQEYEILAAQDKDRWAREMKEYNEKVKAAREAIFQDLPEDMYVYM